MNAAAAGALLGLTGGLGLACVVARLPPLRRIGLGHRLAPYLRDATTPSRLLAGAGSGVGTRAVLGALVRADPALTRLAGALDALLGGRVALARRLQQAGGQPSVDEFRFQQVACAAAGGLAGAAVLAARVVAGVGPSPLVGVLLVVAGVTGGTAARDGWLTRAVRRREEATLAEFPGVAELLALAVTAGESPVGALERVGRAAEGPLGVEMARALADARAGATLVQALGGIASRTSLAPVTRFVDGMAVAIERGTPLADVLRAQAVDVRAAGRRRVLESAGRKEIGMLVPVVFVIMPVTILFAAYPAVVGLSLTAG